MLKRRNPITPGTRWKRSPVTSLGSYNFKIKGLSSKLFNRSGRSPGYSKFARFRCSRNKSNYYYLPRLNEYLNLPAVIVSLFKVSYRTNTLSCIQYVNGSYAYIPSINGLKMGSIISNIGPLSILNLFKSYRLLVGSLVEVRQLPKFSVISNVAAHSLSHSKYAKSSGTYCFINEFLSELELCIIRLPSGVQKVISDTSIVILGRNANVSHKYSVVGKAGANINRGRKQIVRGVAMNPVDHPNGGRTKTNKPEKSLWGWIAKRGM